MALFGDNTADDTINTIAGIIGIHEEGSIGMLYVKPEYRHRKFATAPETYASTGHWKTDGYHMDR